MKQRKANFLSLDAHNQVDDYSGTDRSISQGIQGILEHRPYYLYSTACATFIIFTSIVHKT